MNGQPSVVTMKNGSAKTSVDYESTHRLQHEFEQWNAMYDERSNSINDDSSDKRSVLHYDIGSYDKTRIGCFRGTLTFALRYDYIHRVLMVHVIRANHLSSKVRIWINCQMLNVYFCRCC